MSDTERVERLEKMVDLIAEATLNGTAYAPVLSQGETRELLRLREELRAAKVEEKRHQSDDKEPPVDPTAT